jgi:glucan phosphorylase
MFHMNEGHAAFLSLALLEEEIGDPDLERATEADIEEIRQKCVFTTHTPVPAGHDQFFERADAADSRSRPSIGLRGDALLPGKTFPTRIARSLGSIQLVFAGKAHPQDEGGKSLIRRVVEIASRYDSEWFRIAYVPNYDMEWVGSSRPEWTFG